MKEISSRESVSQTCIRHHLAKRIKIRKKGKSNKITFSNEIISSIKHEYTENNTPIHILGKKYNVDPTVIKRILIENNAKIRPIYEAKLKYKKDYLFFKNPENWEQKHAYFLGWLMSDGTHGVKNRYIKISLQERDKKILEILKNIIQYEGPLLYNKRNGINETIAKYTKTYQNRWSLQVNHYEITNSLLELGIDNNKTNNLRFPRYLKTELIPHFLRSFYEGDGTISYNFYKGQIRFEINLISTKVFCEEVKKILENITISSQIIPAQNVKNGNVVLRINGNNNAIKFFIYAYTNAKFVLRRKFKRFIKFLNLQKRTAQLYDTELENNNRDMLNRAILIALDVAKNAEY
jgi:ABC-type oligopeptide transport system ATPase subunit